MNLNNLDFVKSFIEEFGEPLKSGMSGNLLYYSAKFEDLLDYAIKNELIKQDEANNWDIRCADNLLNIIGISYIFVEADEQENEKNKEYEWFVYWS